MSSACSAIELRCKMVRATLAGRIAVHKDCEKAKEGFRGSSATRKLWQKSRWVLVNAETVHVDFKFPITRLHRSWDDFFYF